MSGESGIRHYTIKLNSEFNHIRDKAIGLLLKFLESEDEKTILNGIEIIYSVGNAGAVGIGKDDRETSERIMTERITLITKLIKLYSVQKNNFTVVNSIENLFIKWWSSQFIPDEITEPFLIEMERPIDYLFMRRFVSPDYFVIDFRELFKCKVNENRWEWYVHNVMSEKWENNSNCVKEIANQLNIKYQSNEVIIEFLLQSDAVISEYPGIWANPNILTFWVSCNRKEFQNIYRDKELWSKVPKRFSLEIELGILKGNEDEFNELAEKILSNEGNLTRDLVEAFLTLSSERDMESRVLENCLNIITDIYEPYVNNLVMFHLLHIFQKHKLPNIHLSILLKLVKTLDFENEHQLVYLSSNIKAIKESIDISENATYFNIKKILLDKIKNVQKLNYDLDMIIGLICENISEVTDIIAYRIKLKINDDCPINFDVVPYEGLKSVDEKIIKYNDFKTLLEMLKGYYSDFDELYMYELKKLIEEISNKVNYDTNEKFLSIYIKELLANNDILNAIYSSYYLPRTADSLDILVMILEEAQRQSLFKEIERLLYRLRTIGSLSWTTGETPQELLYTKDFLIELYKRQTSVRIKVIISKMLKSIDLEIDRIKRLDEERLNPRV